MGNRRGRPAHRLHDCKKRVDIQPLAARCLRRGRDYFPAMSLKIVYRVSWSGNEVTGNLLAS